MGINCLVALQREAWRNESGAAKEFPMKPRKTVTFRHRLTGKLASPFRKRLRRQGISNHLGGHAPSKRSRLSGAGRSRPVGGWSHDDTMTVTSAACSAPRQLVILVPSPDAPPAGPLTRDQARSFESLEGRYHGRLFAWSGIMSPGSTSLGPGP